MTCTNCKDTGWVCENHDDRSWLVDGESCCGGAGMPCPKCNVAVKGQMPRGLPGETEIWNIHKGWIN